MIPKPHRYRKNMVAVQSFIAALVNYESLVSLFLKPLTVILNVTRIWSQGIITTNSTYPHIFLARF